METRRFQHVRMLFIHLFKKSFMKFEIVKKINCFKDTVILELRQRSTSNQISNEFLNEMNLK